MQLSKYARNVVSSKEDMCIRFKDGLNDEIKMLMAALKIHELVELFEHGQKIKEICSSKRQSDARFWDFGKRGSFKSAHLFLSKKIHSKDNRLGAPSEFINRDRSKASNLKMVNLPTANVGSVRNMERVILVCNDCGRKHFEEYRSKLGACFCCGSTELFLRDCPLK